jgi:UDP-2-acetamido-3-amino-2,3-dideoxy-glucuronate N-acetyltransferase
VIHPDGICEGKIGDGTRVWAFAHVMPGAVLGRDCNVGEGAYIEDDVILGDRVTVKNRAQLFDGLRVGDDVFIGPGVVFCNDPSPRSRVPRTSVGPITVGRGASIGANATILPGVTIGEDAMVGAGCVVVHDVPPGATVIGNPARIMWRVR